MDTRRKNKAWGLVMISRTACFSSWLGFGIGSLDLAFAWCFLGQDQSQQDGHVEKKKKALDLAVLFDYWGREAGCGETVMREKGDKGEGKPFYQ